MSTSTEVGGLSSGGRRDVAALFGRGERTVTVDRAAAVLGVGSADAAKRLAALASRGWLRRVRRGLYLSVPVDAPDPSAWTEDPWYLADLVWSPCYVTGWSAANHWSLTDQVFRATVIATAQRVRRVEQELAGSPYLVHHVVAAQFEWGLEVEWRHDRRISVADPARTVAEMLVDPALGGGIRHTAEVLDTFLDGHDSAALLDGLERIGSGAAFKRLGYLIESMRLDLPTVIEACEGHVTAGYIDLDPSMPSRGARSTRWRLRANVEVGS